MEKISLITVSIYGLGILIGLEGSAFARGHARRGSLVAADPFENIGICWTDPASSSGVPTSSSSDTVSTNYGVVLAMESGNGNEIAADVFSLDSNMRKIKQVGHADTTAAQAGSGETTFTSAADSPSQFSLTLTAQDGASGEPRDRGLMTGQLTNAALFTGDVASGIALKCRVVDLNSLPTPNPSSSPSSSPSPAPSPVSSPTPSPSLSSSGS